MSSPVLLACDPPDDPAEQGDTLHSATDLSGNIMVGQGTALQEIAEYGVQVLQGRRINLEVQGAVESE